MIRIPLETVALMGSTDLVALFTESKAEAVPAGSSSSRGSTGGAGGSAAAGTGSYR